MTNVTSTAAAASDTLREIKPPVAIINVWLWVAIGALLLALAAVAIGLILFLVLRKKPVVQPPPIPAHVRAKQKLKEALELISQPKPFCIAVSDTLRFYLEERFRFHAPERTTEEFLYELQATNRLLPDQKESLGEFLKRCDLVKFAQYEPREPELLGLHESAVRLVEETEPGPVIPEIKNPQTESNDREAIGNRQSAIGNRK
jgi:hypothetical protein